jgi:hypothetical protein
MDRKTRAAGPASRAQMQPNGEMRANKSKQMKAKTLAFACYYFSEPGLFNGLWLRTPKISKSSLRLCAKRLKARLCSPGRQSGKPWDGRLSLIITAILARVSYFRKNVAQF